MNLANNIKSVARAHGVTITQLANELGVLQPQMSRTINNPRITAEDLQKIATVIGCSVGDFFRDEATSQHPVIVCPHCGKEMIIRVE